MFQYAKVIKQNSVRQTNIGTFLIFGSHKSFKTEFKEKAQGEKSAHHEQPWDTFVYRKDGVKQDRDLIPHFKENWPVKACNSFFLRKSIVTMLNATLL